MRLSIKEILMQSPTRINPEIKDPSISDFPMTDDPASPKNPDVIAKDDDAAEDKSMPSQSGGNLNNEEDYTELGTTEFQKNKINKYGGKPKGDESITNRGVTKADPNKDKAI
jgi:hypothetical protein